MGTSIDRFLARTGSRDARPDVAPAPPLGMAVDLAPPDPVRSARILKAQATSGLSGDIVDRQLDQIEHHEQQQRFNPPVFEQATPITAAWLAEDPHHIAVAQDDLPALSYLERQFRHVKDQFQAGRATTTLTDIGTAAILGRVSPEQRAEQAALEHEMGSHVDYGIGTGHEILHRFGPLGDAIAAAFSATPAGRLATKAGQLVEQTPGYVANQVPIFGQTMKGKVIGAGVGAAGGALVGAATGPGALATAGAGATMGWRVGGIPAAAQMEAALAYLDYEKIKDDRGLPLDRRAAVGAALVTGAVNGALEAFSFETVAKSIPGLRSLGRDGMRQLLAKETSRSAIESALKHIGESATTEGSTEFLQEYVTNLSGRIVQLIQEGKPLSVGELLDRTVLDPQFFAQAVESAKGGALGGGGIAAAGGVLSLAQTPTRIRKAEQMTRVFQALGDGAEDSKLLERLPEKMQDVVTRMTANGPLEHVYAPVEQFTEYFQGVGLDPADVAEEIFGSRDQYEEALRTGQDLAIPTARYAVTIAPTEHNAFFADELRFSPTDMNAREAREAAAQLDADEQQQRDAEAPAADAAAAVGESVTSQLVGAGFDEQTASTYATLLESTFRTLGQRTGTDPKALFDRFGLTIARRESPDAPWRASRPVGSSSNCSSWRRSARTPRTGPSTNCARTRTSTRTGSPRSSRRGSRVRRRGRRRRSPISRAFSAFRTRSLPSSRRAASTTRRSSIGWRICARNSTSARAWPGTSMCAPTRASICSSASSPATRGRAAASGSASPRSTSSCSRARISRRSCTRRDTSISRCWASSRPAT
jgi:hypothetical protein